jgi:hypothetical protein
MSLFTYYRRLAVLKGFKKNEQKFATKLAYSLNVTI